MTDFFSRYQKFAPLFLRFGLAIVFLFFGIQKLIDPGQATAEIQLILNFDFADVAAMNFYVALFELSIASALFLGLKVRLAALLATFFVSMFFFSFVATYKLSINPNLYRDLGLVGASIALLLLGPGPLSLDAWMEKRNKIKEEESTSEK